MRMEKSYSWAILAIILKIKSIGKKQSNQGKSKSKIWHEFFILNIYN